MSVQRSNFDLAHGVESVSVFEDVPMLPDLVHMPPNVEQAVRSELSELFKGYVLLEGLFESVAPPPQILQVISDEPINRKIERLRSWLVSIKKNTKNPWVNLVTELLKDEELSHQLLAAYRRTVVGG